MINLSIEQRRWISQISDNLKRIADAMEESNRMKKKVQEIEEKGGYRVYFDDLGNQIRVDIDKNEKEF